MTYKYKTVNGCKVINMLLPEMFVQYDLDQWTVMFEIINQLSYYSAAKHNLWVSVCLSLPTGLGTKQPELEYTKEKWEH